MSQAAFHSVTNLKLQNTYVVTNAVNKVKAAFDFSEASCPDASSEGSEDSEPGKSS